jgi:uncharacterized membrane protein HdeD (DUF308 family)
MHRTNIAEQESERENMDSKILSAIWWTLAIRGALAVLFGLVAFFYTGQTITALVYVFGVFALLSGLVTLVAAVRAGEAHQHWGWLAASGVIGVLAGVTCFVNPNATALAFVYIIAAWAILSGVAEITFALALPQTLAHPWLTALSGALSVVFGVLLAVWPKSGETALVWLIGIYAIANGVTQLYHAFLLQVARKGVQALGSAGERLAAGHSQG